MLYARSVCSARRSPAEISGDTRMHAHTHPARIAQRTIGKKGAKQTNKKQKTITTTKKE
jgi:hypothetical protein